MQTFINPGREKWAEIIERPKINDAELKFIVADILKDVKENGDSAIKKYSLQFGKVLLGNLKVSDAEIVEAVDLVDEDLKSAIQLAKRNIEKFHVAQKQEEKKLKLQKEYCVGVNL
jgi:histidinol dehydrogenase